jgi:hypothetical protein
MIIDNKKIVIVVAILLVGIAALVMFGNNQKSDGDKISDSISDVVDSAGDGAKELREEVIDEIDDNTTDRR